MNHFRRFTPDSILTPEDFYNHFQPPAPVFRKPDASLEIAGSRSVSVPDELKNQFVVFQVLSQEGGQTIAEASTVEPKIEGSENQPDMYVSVELQSFHLAQSELVDKDTRATMRLVMSKDKNSRNKVFDDVFWTISAGLDFYNQIKDQRAKPEEFKADFNKALGNRPIEIPGGLANLTFEVIKHKEPKWWQKVFSFLKSDAGKALISVIGFPGITSAAVNMLDEVLERFDSNTSQVLFQSRPMILALSKLAKDDYTGGNPRIKMGCLNPGFCVLARGRDFHTIANADAFFYPHYGKLVPASVEPGDVVSGNYDDPFAEVTYVVFKIGMVPTRLELRFNYGAATV